MSKWGWLREGVETAPITQTDLDQLEAYADRLFAKVGIDVEFTRHFLDRVNDERNQRQITLAELTRLFKQEFKKWGKKIAQLGPDAEAVMKDMKTDVNMPFVLVWDKNNEELDLIAKTVMRKDNFKTSNPEFAIESVDPILAFIQDKEKTHELSYGNCGILAIALDQKFDMDEFIYVTNDAEPDKLYHVAAVKNGKIYDADGITNISNVRARGLDDEYPDEEPQVDHVPAVEPEYNYILKGTDPDIGTDDLLEDAGAAVGFFSQFSPEEIKQLAIVLGVTIPVLKAMYYTASGINKIKRAIKGIGKKDKKKKGIFAEVAGVGVIDAQNTTADVKPGETQRQAAKLGIKLNKDNEPPLLHAKATKNSQDTNKVAQLTERWKQYNEITADPRIKKTDIGREDWDEYIGLTKKIASIKGYDIHFYANDKDHTHHYLIKDPNSEGFLGELKLDGYGNKYHQSSVFFDPEIQGKGLGLPLYAYVIKKGYTLVSDQYQSLGSREGIWKKLTQLPGIFVYAWDKKYDEFFQWNPEEDLDSEIYYDQEKLNQLNQDYKDGKINHKDYRIAKDELEQVHRFSDVRLVAIANKQKVKEDCKYGSYYCSTDKKIKCRQSPKKSRTVSEVEQIDVKKDEMGISPDLFQDALDGSGAKPTGDSVKNYPVARGEHGNTIYYFLLDGDKPFGMLKLVGAPGRGKMSMAMMLPEYQGKGVMPGLYKLAIRDVGTIKSDVEQSAGGTAIWKRLAQDPDVVVYAYNEKSDEYAMVDDNLDSKFSTVNKAQDVKDLEAEETKELAHLLDLQLNGEIDREEYKRRVSDLRKAYEKEIIDIQDPGSVYFVATTTKGLAEGPQDFTDMKLDGNKLQQSLDYFYTDHAPSKIGGRKDAGLFKGHNVVTFTKDPDTLMFLVNKNDQAVFYVAYHTFKDGIAIGNVRSNGTLRATEVYAYLVKKFGTLYSDNKQTPQGRKIWADLAKFFPDISVTDTGDRLQATNKVVENVAYSNPQFDVEWEEANRYDFLDKLGKDEWIKLAQAGKAVTVDANSVKKIGNTGADGSETFNDLEPEKVARFKKAVKSGTIEMPIVMKMPNGKLELIAGNTRLIGLINTQGNAKVWYIDASKLEENFADGKKPGRKGLAKRVGVDCSKSVTDLRKIAKNSSGEKQRMAHWCANMKAGRKKK